MIMAAWLLFHWPMIVFSTQTMHVTVWKNSVPVPPTEAKYQGSMLYRMAWNWIHLECYVQKGVIEVKASPSHAESCSGIPQ